MDRAKAAAMAVKRHIESWLETRFEERLRRESLNLLHSTLISTRADVPRWDDGRRDSEDRIGGGPIWKCCRC